MKLTLETHRNKQAVKPLLVKFQTTGECNFQCVYCFNDLAIRKHIMTQETMHTAVDYALNNPYASNGVYFSIYGGEPYTERQLLFDTIRYIREKDIQGLSIINVITNGSLLTDEDIEYVKNNDIHLSISYDGMPNFQKENRICCNNIEDHDVSLEVIKKFRGYDKMTVLTTVTKNMSGHLLDIALFMEENKIPSIEFLPLRMLGQAEGNIDLSVNVTEYIRSLKDIIDAIEDGKIKETKIRAVIRMMLPLETGQTLHGDVEGHRCGSGRNVISINYDGNITGCDMIPTEFSPIIGNVWDGITSLNLLDKNIRPYSQISGSCLSCPWNLYCRSGCTGASCSDNGSCNSKHFLSCAIIKTIYPYILEKMVTDGGKLHEYFLMHTTAKSIEEKHYHEHIDKQ